MKPHVKHEASASSPNPGTSQVLEHSTIGIRKQKVAQPWQKDKNLTPHEISFDERALLDSQTSITKAQFNYDKAKRLFNSRISIAQKSDSIQRRQEEQYENKTKRDVKGSPATIEIARNNLIDDRAVLKQELLKESGSSSNCADKSNVKDRNKYFLNTHKPKTSKVDSTKCHPVPLLMINAKGRGEINLRYGLMPRRKVSKFMYRQIVRSKPQHARSDPSTQISKISGFVEHQDIIAKSKEAKSSMPYETTPYNCKDTVNFKTPLGKNVRKCENKFWMVQEYGSFDLNRDLKERNKYFKYTEKPKINEINQRQCRDNFALSGHDANKHEISSRYVAFTRDKATKRKYGQILRSKAKRVRSDPSTQISKMSAFSGHQEIIHKTNEAKSTMPYETTPNKCKDTFNFKTPLVKNVRKCENKFWKVQDCMSFDPNRDLKERNKYFKYTEKPKINEINQRQYRDNFALSDHDTKRKYRQIVRSKTKCVRSDPSTQISKMSGFIGHQKIINKTNEAKSTMTYETTQYKWKDTVKQLMQKEEHLKTPITANLKQMENIYWTVQDNKSSDFWDLKESHKYFQNIEQQITNGTSSRKCSDISVSDLNTKSREEISSRHAPIVRHKLRKCRYGKIVRSKIKGVRSDPSTQINKISGFIKHKEMISEKKGAKSIMSYETTPYKSKHTANQSLQTEEHLPKPIGKNVSIYDTELQTMEDYKSSDINMDFKDRNKYFQNTENPTVNEINQRQCRDSFTLLAHDANSDEISSTCVAFTRHNLDKSKDRQMTRSKAKHVHFDLSTQISKEHRDMITKTQETRSTMPYDTSLYKSKDTVKQRMQKEEQLKTQIGMNVRKSENKLSTVQDYKSSELNRDLKESHKYFQNIEEQIPNGTSSGKCPDISLSDSNTKIRAEISSRNVPIVQHKFSKCRYGKIVRSKTKCVRLDPSTQISKISGFIRHKEMISKTKEAKLIMPYETTPYKSKHTVKQSLQTEEHLPKPIGKNVSKYDTELQTMKDYKSSDINRDLKDSNKNIQNTEKPKVREINQKQYRDSCTLSANDANEHDEKSSRYVAFTRHKLDKSKYGQMVRSKAKHVHFDPSTQISNEHRDMITKTKETSSIMAYTTSSYKSKDTVKHRMQKEELLQTPIGKSARKYLTKSQDYKSSDVNRDLKNRSKYFQNTEKPKIDGINQRQCNDSLVLSAFDANKHDDRSSRYAAFARHKGAKRKYGHMFRSKVKHIRSDPSTQINKIDEFIENHNTISKRKNAKSTMPYQTLPYKSKDTTKQHMQIEEHLKTPIGKNDRKYESEFETIQNKSPDSSRNSKNKTTYRQKTKMSTTETKIECGSNKSSFTSDYKFMVDLKLNEDCKKVSLDTLNRGKKEFTHSVAKETIDDQRFLLRHSKSKVSIGVPSLSNEYMDQFRNRCFNQASDLRPELEPQVRNFYKESQVAQKYFANHYDKKEHRLKRKRLSSKINNTLYKKTEGDNLRKLVANISLKSLMAPFDKTEVALVKKNKAAQLRSSNSSNSYFISKNTITHLQKKSQESLNRIDLEIWEYSNISNENYSFDQNNKQIVVTRQNIHNCTSSLIKCYPRISSKAISKPNNESQHQIRDILPDYCLSSSSLLPQNLQKTGYRTPIIMLSRATSLINISKKPPVVSPQNCEQIYEALNVNSQEIIQICISKTGNTEKRLGSYYDSAVVKKKTKQIKAKERKPVKPLSRNLYNVVASVQCFYDINSCNETISNTLLRKYDAKYCDFKSSEPNEYIKPSVKKYRHKHGHRKCLDKVIATTAHYRSLDRAIDRQTRDQEHKNKTNETKLAPQKTFKSEKKGPLKFFRKCVHVIKNIVSKTKQSQVVSKGVDTPSKKHKINKHDPKVYISSHCPKIGVERVDKKRVQNDERTVVKIRNRQSAISSIKLRSTYSLGVAIETTGSLPSKKNDESRVHSKKAQKRKSVHRSKCMNERNIKLRRRAKLDKGSDHLFKRTGVVSTSITEIYKNRYLDRGTVARNKKSLKPQVGSTKNRRKPQIYWDVQRLNSQPRHKTEILNYNIYQTEYKDDPSENVYTRTLNRRLKDDATYSRVTHLRYSTESNECDYFKCKKTNKQLPHSGGDFEIRSLHRNPTRSVQQRHLNITDDAKECQTQNSKMVESKPRRYLFLSPKNVDELSNTAWQTCNKLAKNYNVNNQELEQNTKQIESQSLRKTYSSVFIRVWRFFSGNKKPPSKDEPGSHKIKKGKKYANEQVKTQLEVSTSPYKRKISVYNDLHKAESDREHENSLNLSSLEKSRSLNVAKEFYEPNQKRSRKLKQSIRNIIVRPSGDYPMSTSDTSRKKYNELIHPLDYYKYDSFICKHFQVLHKKNESNNVFGGLHNRHVTSIHRSKSDKKTGPEKRISRSVDMRNHRRNTNRQVKATQSCYYKFCNLKKSSLKLGIRPRRIKTAPPFAASERPSKIKRRWKFAYPDECSDITKRSNSISTLSWDSKDLDIWGESKDKITQIEWIKKLKNDGKAYEGIQYNAIQSSRHSETDQVPVCKCCTRFSSCPSSNRSKYSLTEKILNIAKCSKTSETEKVPDIAKRLNYSKPEKCPYTSKCSKYLITEKIPNIDKRSKYLITERDPNVAKRSKYSKPEKCPNTSKCSKYLITENIPNIDKRSKYLVTEKDPNIAKRSNYSKPEKCPNISKFSKYLITEKIPTIAKHSKYSATEKVPNIAKRSKYSKTEKCPNKYKCSKYSITEKIPDIVKRSKYSATEKVPNIAKRSKYSKTEKVPNIAKRSKYSKTEKCPNIYNCSKYSITAKIPNIVKRSKYSETEKCPNIYKCSKYSKTEKVPNIAKRSKYSKTEKCSNIYKCSKYSITEKIPNIAKRSKYSKTETVPNIAKRSKYWKTEKCTNIYQCSKYSITGKIPNIAKRSKYSKTEKCPNKYKCSKYSITEKIPDIVKRSKYSATEKVPNIAKRSKYSKTEKVPNIAKRSKYSKTEKCPNIYKCSKYSITAKIPNIVKRSKYSKTEKCPNIYKCSKYSIKQKPYYIHKRYIIMTENLSQSNDLKDLYKRSKYSKIEKCPNVSKCSKYLITEKIPYIAKRSKYSKTEKVPNIAKRSKYSKTEKCPNISKCSKYLITEKIPNIAKCSKYSVTEKVPNIAKRSKYLKTEKCPNLSKCSKYLITEKIPTIAKCSKYSVTEKVPNIGKRSKYSKTEKCPNISKCSKYLITEKIPNIAKCSKYSVIEKVPNIAKRSKYSKTEKCPNISKCSKYLITEKIPNIAKCSKYSVTEKVPNIAKRSNYSKTEKCPNIYKCSKYSITQKPYYIHKRYIIMTENLPQSNDLKDLYVWGRRKNKIRQNYRIKKLKYATLRLKESRCDVTPDTWCRSKAYESVECHSRYPKTDQERVKGYAAINNIGKLYMEDALDGINGNSLYCKTSNDDINVKGRLRYVKRKKQIEPKLKTVKKIHHKHKIQHENKSTCDYGSAIAANDQKSEIDERVYNRDESLAQEVSTFPVQKTCKATKTKKKKYCPTTVANLCTKKGYAGTNDMGGYMEDTSPSVEICKLISNDNLEYNVHIDPKTTKRLCCKTSNNNIDVTGGLCYVKRKEYKRQIKPKCKKCLLRRNCKIKKQKKKPCCRVKKIIRKGAIIRACKLYISYQQLKSAIKRKHRYRALFRLIYKSRNRKRERSYERIARCQHKYYKKKIRMRDKYARERINDPSIFQVADSIEDLGVLGARYIESVAQFAYKNAMDPALMFKPKPLCSICKKREYNTNKMVARSTYERIKFRIKSMDWSKLMRVLERNKFFVYLLNRYSKGKRKAHVKQLTDDEIMKNCDLFVMSIRKKPHFWVHALCPRFYPYCIGIHRFWKQVSLILTFMVAIVVWSPCLICIEVSRLCFCCLFCNQ